MIRCRTSTDVRGVLMALGLDRRLKKSTSSQRTLMELVTAREAEEEEGGGHLEEGARSVERDQRKRVSLRGC